MRFAFFSLAQPAGHSAPPEVIPFSFGKLSELLFERLDRVIVVGVWVVLIGRGVSGVILDSSCPVVLPARNESELSAVVEHGTRKCCLYPDLIQSLE